MKILYAPVQFKVDTSSVLDKISKISGDKAVVTVSQYEELLKDIKVKNKGVVLGCDASTLKGFNGGTIVFIGDGVFHPLNIKKSYPSKKVFTINPFTLTVAEITDAEVKKYAFREAVGNDKLKHACNVGIIITSKLGQNKTREAIKLKTTLERKGKNVYLFLSDNINPDEFLNFLGLDLLINTACPRIAMDDYSKFPVTVLDIHSIKES